MKNRNRTGRQKYFSADRRCKACVYNGGKRRGERICLTAVSYTHLDVYKRQLPNTSLGVAPNTPRERRTLCVR